MIWDTRGRNGPQISLEAHSADVNVISWNKTVSNLLASGSDDGSFKVKNVCIFFEMSLTICCPTHIGLGSTNH
jgi:ribosome assembly protein RRB1